MNKRMITSIVRRVLALQNLSQYVYYKEDLRGNALVIKAFMKEEGFDILREDFGSRFDHYYEVSIKDDDYEYGQKTRDIQVDHITPFSYLLEDHDIQTIDQALSCGPLWDTENGRTLCLRCHRKTPTYGNQSRYDKDALKKLDREAKTDLQETLTQD